MRKVGDGEAEPSHMHRKEETGAKLLFPSSACIFVPDITPEKPSRSVRVMGEGHLPHTLVYKGSGAL